MTRIDEMDGHEIDVITLLDALSAAGRSEAEATSQVAWRQSGGRSSLPYGRYGRIQVLRV